jgi:hypothetical protein
MVRATLSAEIRTMPAPSQPFRGQYDVHSSVLRWYEVTPSNDAFLPVLPRLVHCRSGGAVALEDADGNVVVWEFPVGGDKPLSPVRIRATGTEATGIVVGY